MTASYGVVDGKPSVVRHDHVNLGLAIDQQKSDGTRTLLVPNIKAADTLDFAAFHAAYEDLIRRARSNKLTVDDFAGTTVSITNPGTIGTMHSVPRLMPGQELIVGVGAITYPPEYEGPDPPPQEGSIDAQHKGIAVQQLINMYRVRGHLIANLDPLGLKEPKTHEELDPNHWGLTIWDLDREFPTGGLAGKATLKLRDILGVLRDAYARTIGVEYMHIQEFEEKAWIQKQVE